MWLTSSSVGRKLVMALTGCFLILFLTFHALMNGVCLFWPSAYNVVCEFLGANWYALVGSALIAVVFLLHIIYAIWLTIQNRKARGHERYEVTSRPPQVEWSSKNMLVLGFVVLAFLVFHLIQFWCKMQFAEICEFEGLHTLADGNVVPTAAGTWFIQIAFGGALGGLVLGIYLAGMLALWFHLQHGFWSMWQSSGWNGRIWLPRLKKIGCWYVTIVMGLFAAEAIVFTVQAQRGAYLDCPVLQQQYIQMALDGEGDMNMPSPQAKNPFGGEACPFGNAECGQPCGNTCGGEGQCGDCGSCAPGQCPNCTCPEGTECSPEVCAQNNCQGLANCNGGGQCAQQPGQCPSCTCPEGTECSPEACAAANCQGKCGQQPCPQQGCAECPND